MAETSWVSFDGGSDRSEQISSGKKFGWRWLSEGDVAAALSGLEGLLCPLESFFFGGTLVSLYGHFFIPNRLQTFLIAV